MQSLLLSTHSPLKSLAFTNALSSVYRGFASTRSDDSLTYKRRPHVIKTVKNIFRERFFELRFAAMGKPRLLLLSSSKVDGFDGYLEYARKDIIHFLDKNNVSSVTFIPYALPDHDAYFTKVYKAFEAMGYKADSIHKYDDPAAAVQKADALFVGGGNTFLLLKTLYDQQLIKVIRDRVLLDGIPYVGTSAGSNVAAASIHNTNDMPIVYPPSFAALKLIPFNINPHYVDADPKSKHKGETREERILQYQSLPKRETVYTVLGLREGCTLEVDGQSATLKGINKARLFIRGRNPEEIHVGNDLSHLFTSSRNTLSM